MWMVAIRENPLFATIFWVIPCNPIVGGLFSGLASDREHIVCRVDGSQCGAVYRTAGWGEPAELVLSVELIFQLRSSELIPVSPPRSQRKWRTLPPLPQRAVARSCARDFHLLAAEFPVRVIERRRARAWIIAARQKFFLEISQPLVGRWVLQTRVGLR